MAESQGMPRQRFLKREILVYILFFLTYMPTWIWMYDRWMDNNSYYGHGPLIPLISLALIFNKRSVLTGLEQRSSDLGLKCIYWGMAVHLLSALFQIYFTSGFSMLIVLAGIILHFHGEKVLKKSLFPLFFLIFMIPLPIIIVITFSFKLKLLAAKLAVFILNQLKIPAIREGSLIKMPYSYVVVEDACSGLRSLISLMALGSLFGYSMQSTLFKRFLLFAVSIPIAVFTNALRITLLSFVSEIWGSAYAAGVLHNLSGFLVFAIAYVLLIFAKRIIA